MRSTFSVTPSLLCRGPERTAAPSLLCRGPVCGEILARFAVRARRAIGVNWQTCPTALPLGCAPHCLQSTLFASAGLLGYRGRGGLTRRSVVEGLGRYLSSEATRTAFALPRSRVRGNACSPLPYVLGCVNWQTSRADRAAARVRASLRPVDAVCLRGSARVSRQGRSDAPFGGGGGRVSKIAALAPGA